MRKNRIAKIFATMAIAATMGATAANQPLAVQKISATDGTACGLPVTGVSINHDDNNLTVGMTLNLGEYDMKGDRASVFVPVLKNGNDSITLNPVGLYGRIRYIQYLRHDQKPIGGTNETSYKYDKRPATLPVVQTVPYQEWMNGASLYINRTDYGCCNNVLDECASTLASWNEVEYVTEFVYLRTTVDAVKTRELSGRAFVDFPVNLTTIYPDYRNNARELAKIIASIDSVRNDKDITIDALSIKGFASPEGPYDNNIRLAKGRTEALKDYVQNLYKFAPGFIKTSYEPEDWEGLREFVVNSGLADKDQILAIINSDLAPDPKNTKIQTTYPATYKFLLETVYPGLRHSDYKIEYTIRSFTDVNEIAEVFRTAPYKLNLNEMLLYAESLESGSDAYNNVFETAARLYPDSEVANLNAANSAMQRGDMVNAEQYLSKAGDSDAANYTRGVKAALEGDYATALNYFNRAAATVNEAAAAAEILNEIVNYNK